MEIITIAKEDYDSLMEDRRWLTALESAGVDNWNGLSFAYELLAEMEEEQDD